MNLQTIQKRVEELSSQLLTLSNDLAYLLEGEVVRHPVAVGIPVSHFTELTAGDIIQIPHDFTDIDQDTHAAGTYKVESVEREAYSGYWNVEIQVAGDDCTWLNFSVLNNVTKV